MIAIHSIGWLLAASNTPEISHKLDAYGWIVMLASVGAVLAIITYCLYRVFTLPPAEQDHLKGPLDIDTGDTQDAD